MVVDRYGEVGLGEGEGNCGEEWRGKEMGTKGVSQRK